ncbi:AzlC family ABC transporter permease [Marinibacterium profundimaris]|uniref:Branched-chain amino acid transporter AzlC n=1 Tax=Marinibacterium profundimaris TaxID=1679460 RepID=A0A225NHR7_9RHOB|nr:AzlC family ABC transporter permease [Marinibacterium profundimaris]OWU73375.1 branched-chain amino acid transporter AzlC [Marinibacterium profundimaris]
MTSSTTNRALWRGARNSLPFIFVAGPFGLLFGVVASEAGLHVLESFSFSIAVFAGAAQFTALQLLEDNAPTLIVLVSALAVNLRCAMYSAALTPHMGAVPMWQRAFGSFFIVDQSYALSIVEFENKPDMSIAEKWAYFWGTNIIIAPLWVGMTLLGALVGGRIPETWSLDFAVPIAFIAITATMLRTPAHMAAAFVAITVSILTAGVPHNLGLIIAGIAGMITGAVVEAEIEKRTGRLL